MVEKLTDFREEESYQMKSGETANLVTEISDLKLEEDSLGGVFSRDFVSRRYYRRKLVEDLITEEAPFWVKRFKERTFMIVLAPSGSGGGKKLLTGHIANRIDRTLFVRPHAIVAIWGDGKGAYRLLSPCGRCREIISDFNPDTWVIVGSLDHPYKVKVSDLLPLKNP